MTDSARQAVARAGKALFGQPLVTNTVRGVLVEAMIAEVLEPEWTWCAADYASWDFEKSDDRLEVKQSASLQSWNGQSRKASACSFDIAFRSQAWVDKAWMKGHGRAASLYVFAHHPLIDADADHREPAQWDFYVVPTHELPTTARITLAKVRNLAAAVDISDLLKAVNAALVPRPLSI